MDTQQSRHVVLEDTPSDIVTLPVLPVQMPATQTLHATSHDQAFHPLSHQLPLLRILILVWADSSRGLDR